MHLPIDIKVHHHFAHTGINDPWVISFRGRIQLRCDTRCILLEMAINYSEYILLNVTTRC